MLFNANVVDVKNVAEENAVLASFECYNTRRYSRPWVCAVENGKCDFGTKVGEYTARSGEAGDIIVYAPKEGKTYAWGQKDVRVGSNTLVNYVKALNGKFYECDRFGKLTDEAQEQYDADVAEEVVEEVVEEKTVVSVENQEEKAMLTKVEMVELVEEAFKDSDAVYYEAAVLRAVRENALEIDRYGHGHQGKMRYGLCSDEYVLITRPDIDSVPCDERNGGMTAVAIKAGGHILNLYELQWAIKEGFTDEESYADACDWDNPDVVTVINDIGDEEVSIDARKLHQATA